MCDKIVEFKIYKEQCNLKTSYKIQFSDSCLQSSTEVTGLKYNSEKFLQRFHTSFWSSICWLNAQFCSFVYYDYSLTKGWEIGTILSRNFISFLEILSLILQVCLEDPKLTEFSVWEELLLIRGLIKRKSHSTANKITRKIENITTPKH